MGDKLKNYCHSFASSTKGRKDANGEDLTEKFVNESKRFETTTVKKEENGQGNLKFERNDDDNELYIGNLRKNSEKSKVVEKLKLLFSTAGVDLRDEAISELQNGPRKSKHLYVRLNDGIETSKMILQFDGLQDSEIVCENKVLKVCLAKEKPTRKRRKKNQGLLADKSENFSDGVNVAKDVIMKLIEKTDFEKECLSVEGMKLQSTASNVKQPETVAHMEMKKESEYMETFSSEDGQVCQIERRCENMEEENGEMRKKFRKQFEDAIDVQNRTLLNSKNLEKNPRIDSEKCNVLVMGQILHTEDRRTEYKRGRGQYPEKYLVGHVRKYICAFLNSEGGRLLIGVADNGQVHGIPCDRKQEDILRRQIDNVIGKFQPPVFPDMYSINFIPVLPHAEYEVTLNNEQLLKVLEIKIDRPIRRESCLFETDRGEVFVKRDGSVQGPLKASQIIDWCKNHGDKEQQDTSRVQRSEVMVTDVFEDKGRWGSNLSNNLPFENAIDIRADKHSIHTITLSDRHLEMYSLSRLGEIEASIRERQKAIEREIVIMRGRYEAREKALQAELERSQNLLKNERKKRRPKSATCRIL